MNKLKKWLSENKDNPTFKHTVLIVVLIILAIAAQLFDTVVEIIDNCKGHIIMLVITGTALAVVEYKKKHKIKESK